MLMKRFGKPSTWTAASRVTGAALMLLGPGGLAGCKGGGVVDNQYEGQELARINGQITSTVAPEQDSISIGIVWVTSRDVYKDGGAAGQGGAGGLGGQGGFGGLGGFGGFGGEAGAGGFGGFGGFGGEAGAGGFGGFGGFGGDAGAAGFGGAGGSFGAAGAGGAAQPMSGPTAPSDGRPTAPMASFTLRGRNDPGPTGSLLEPAPVGCDGLPIQVSASLSHTAGATAIARTVTFRPSFPQGFTIPLTALPPAEAMVPLEVAVKGSGVFAEARIVAFVDQNHNDKLDLPSPDSAPDRILAVSQQRIFYLDGVFPPLDVAVTGYNPTMTLPISVGSRLPQGFSLLDLAGSVVPASSPIDLPLATTTEEEDRAAFGVCSRYEEWIEHDGTTPAAPQGAFIVYRDRFVNGHYQVGWNYYPPTGNPCYDVAVLGEICE